MFTSKNVRVLQLDVYPGVCTHHTLVTDIVALSATGEAAYTKRYTARAALTEPVSQLSVMLALYWWWMKHQATLDLDNGSVSIGSWLTIPSPSIPVHQSSCLRAKTSREPLRPPSCGNGTNRRHFLFRAVVVF